MAANYNRPKPVNPVNARPWLKLRITCICGRQMVEEVGRFAQDRGVPGDTALYELFGRLKCRSCGRRPRVEVVGVPG